MALNFPLSNGLDHHVMPICNGNSALCGTAFWHSYPMGACRQYYRHTAYRPLDYANGHDFNDWRPFRAGLVGGNFNDGRSSRALSFGRLVCRFPASWVESGTARICRFIGYGDRHDDIAAFDQTDGAHWPGSGGGGVIWAARPVPDGVLFAVRRTPKMVLAANNGTARSYTALSDFLASMAELRMGKGIEQVDLAQCLLACKHDFSHGISASIVMKAKGLTAACKDLETAFVLTSVTPRYPCYSGKPIYDISQKTGYNYLIFID